jgi:riboflavin synthase alpha subunit
VFTGIVEELGTVRGISQNGDGWWATDVSRETLARAVTGRLAAGDGVNIEMDVLAKHVERLLEPRLGAT